MECVYQRMSVNDHCETLTVVYVMIVIVISRSIVIRIAKENNKSSLTVHYDFKIVCFVLHHCKLSCSQHF